jgi:predicted RNase H-like HicB family nuclease
MCLRGHGEQGQVKRHQHYPHHDRHTGDHNRIHQSHESTQINALIFETGEEGGYHVFCPVLPGCHTPSGTIDEGMQNIREAMPLYIDSLVEDGLPLS